LNETGTKFFYGYIIVIATFIIYLAVFGVHYAFGVFLKPILTEFGWSRAIISGAFSLSWLMQGVSAIVMGKLNDRYGPRVVLTICGILVSSGFLMTTQIDARWQLYLFYGGFIGSGTGGVYVPLVSTIARWFTSRRNTMTGLAVSGIGFGTFLFSPVANYLISVYNWRTSYTILGITLMVIILVATQFLRRDPEKMGQLPYDSQESIEIKQDDERVYSLKEAVMTREFWLVFAMFFCFGFCFSSIIVHIAPHATDIGKSTATAAGLVATIGIASITGKVLFGRIGDRIGNKSIYMICFSMMVFSLLWLTPTRQALLLYLFAVVFGLAYGGNATSQSPLVATLFGLQSHGIIMGTVNNGFTVGATLGPFVSGALFDKMGDYEAAFLSNAFLSFMGLMLSILLKPKKALRVPVER
jgi:MFS family permease